MTRLRALASRLVAWLVRGFQSDETLEALPENDALIRARMAELRREQDDARLYRITRITRMTRHELNAALARGEFL